MRDGNLTAAPETHFLSFGETHIGRVFALHYYAKIIHERKRHLMTQDQQWEPIKYVASNKTVQDLLTLLYDHGSATYDQIKHLANSYVIEQLDKFNLITYNQSRAFGLTKETVIKESTYQLSTKGTNWYRLIMNLANLSNNTVIVQLSIGDFKKFVTHLTNFMYSDDPEAITDAYEFLLDDTTGNFYQRCDAKLNHLRDSASRLQTELITIQNENGIAKTIDQLSAHIKEFSDVARDILETLLEDGKLIEQRLAELEALEHSRYYDTIAKHIEGVTADDTTAERIKNNVNRFIAQLNKNNIYRNFIQKLTTISNTLLTINDYLQNIRTNLETKGKLIELAKHFFNESSLETCDKDFKAIMANKCIHHVTNNAIASLNGRELLITMPNAKPKPKSRPKIDEKKRQYLMNQSTAHDLRKHLKKLKIHQKLLENPQLSGHYDSDTYFTIRQGLLNDDPEQLKTNPELVGITPIDSNTTTIIETTLPNGKTARFTIPNLSLEVKPNNAIQIRIRNVESKLAQLTTEIADYERHQRNG